MSVLQEMVPCSRFSIGQIVEFVLEIDEGTWFCLGEKKVAILVQVVLIALHMHVSMLGEACLLQSVLYL